MTADGYMFLWQDNEEWLERDESGKPTLLPICSVIGKAILIGMNMMKKKTNVYCCLPHPKRLKRVMNIT